MGIVFTRLSGAAARAALTDVYADAYVEIYAEPPYGGHEVFSRAKFLERTRAQVDRPGFELVAALDGPALAGFSFGFTFPAGTWWGGAVDRPPADVLDVPKFAVIELILRREHRGRGDGKQLLGTLLDGRAEPVATLLSHPQAAAHAMYERWGWRVVGTVPLPGGPVMDAMVLPLAK